MTIKENQIKLVEALRSGKYKQGRKQLRDKDRFCFWGVACDLSGLGNWEDRQYSDGGKRYVIDSTLYGSFALPPVEVKDWVGFNDIRAVIIDGSFASLFDHNDNGKSFAQLADAIEQQIINKA